MTKYSARFKKTQIFLGIQDLTKNQEAGFAKFLARDEVLWKEKGIRDKVNGNSGCGIVMSGNAGPGSRFQTLFSVLSQGRDFSHWNM